MIEPVKMMEVWVANNKVRVQELYNKMASCQVLIDELNANTWMYEKYIDEYKNRPTDAYD